MKVGSNMEFIKKKAGGYQVIQGGADVTVATETYFSGHYTLGGLYSRLRNTPEVDRVKVFNEMYNMVKEIHEMKENNGVPFSDDVPETPPRVPVLREGLNAMMKFFSEFAFSPSFRFLNTLARVKGEEGRKTYISNYFKLMNSPYAEEIGDKMESPEFSDILFNLSSVAPTKEINTRFKLYYGAQGTGKTTKALAETDNTCIVCNSSMLPADLMEDFTFDDGKATFHPSALARAMEAGTAITMDELNLLPFDSLRFLQGVFDGKKEFQYKGNTIHIRDGFKVIGTMNLVVNGVAFGLPEPLVDRCEEIREFVLTPEMLEGAF